LNADERAERAVSDLRPVRSGSDLARMLTAEAAQSDGRGQPRRRGRSPAGRVNNGRRLLVLSILSGRVVGSTLGGVRVRCPVLVGRERELVVLADALARAESGDGAAVFVVGAAGIGKSALARSAVALARERGVLALVGRGV
jgi:hypothetical protein